MGDDFKPPTDLNDLLRTAKNFIYSEDSEESKLTDEDKAFLKKCLKKINDGQPAVIIVGNKENVNLTYMFLYCTRVEAMGMMGKVIEVAAHRESTDS